MIETKGYIDIIHDQKSVATMKDFIAFYHIDEITPEKLFDDNRENIFAAMSWLDKCSYMVQHGMTGAADTLTPDKLDPEMTLPRFAKIRVYYTNVRQEDVLYISNVKAKIADYAKWFDERLLEITDSNGFRSEGNVVTKEYRKMAPNIRVCGWFKALDFLPNYRGADTITSTVRDISRYVGAMTVNTTKNGGNFTFSLPHIAVEKIVRGKSGLYEDTIVSAEIENKSYYKTAFADDTSRNEDDYFNWLISPNDLIFLRFEKTVEEINDDLNNRTGEPQLHGDVWDMIGLVDSVSICTDAQGTASNVTVKGRDLMKLLIDDGSFFFPIAMDLGARELFANASGVSVTSGGDGLGVQINCKNALNRLMGRSVSGNILPFRGSMFTLEFVLKEVINWLSNIAIAPDYLFTPWGDERTTMMDIEPPAPENPKKNVK